ncbi:MAG: isoprenyl transferase [Proteobacteria bacterium]|nr:isoprenyl transferase [Pseudomonadota bacterium]
MIEKINLPKGLRHIAIIMDGNGRWAKQRSKNRIFGHRHGSKAVRAVAEACSQMGLEVLTLFAFSTENWARPKKEVDTLMKLFKEFLKKESKTILKNNMRFRITGQMHRLPNDVQKFAKELIDESNSNTGMILNLAVSYGGRLEITEAVKNICRQVIDGKISPDRVTEDTIGNNLWTSDLPNPDLLIRTSGEFRISNFMIWQIAYSEIYITEVLWPDFDKKELARALESFSKRKRRFGKVDE